MWKGKRVSIVFPAFNEEAGIAEAVHGFLAVDAVDEIVVVDNNSGDRTAVLATEAGARVVSEPKQGYGNALRRGMREAEGDLIVLAEPDGTFTGADVVKLLAYSEDAELVLGTRTTRELIWGGANMGPALRWGNWIVAKLLQVMFGTSSLSDVGCTMRLVHREALERFQNELTVGGSHFLPEMVILARLHDIPILEVPVNYRTRRGISKITGEFRPAMKVGLRMIGLILRYRVAVRPTMSRRRRRLRVGDARVADGDRRTPEVQL
jgi:glycosyltransferase involved in cell wall biosynthesis